MVITILSAGSMAFAAQSFSRPTLQNGTISGLTDCGAPGSPNLSYSETALSSPTSSSYIRATHQVVDYYTGATVATPSPDSGFGKSYVLPYVFLSPGRYSSFGAHDFYNRSETIAEYTNYYGFYVY